VGTTAGQGMEEVEMKKDCRGKCGRYPCPDTACEAFCPGPFGLWDFGNLADVLLLVCFHLFHCILAAKWWCFASSLQCTSDFLTCVEKSSGMRVKRFEVLVGLYTVRENAHVLSTRDQGSRGEAEHRGWILSLWRQSARDAEAW
jgi:hypothetical protein